MMLNYWYSLLLVTVTSDQGRFYVGAGGGAQAPQMLARPPSKYFGSNSKNTYS